MPGADTATYKPLLRHAPTLVAMVAVSRWCGGGVPGKQDKRTVRLALSTPPVGEQNKRRSQARRSRAQRVAANEQAAIASAA